MQLKYINTSAQRLPGSFTTCLAQKTLHASGMRKKNEILDFFQILYDCDDEIIL